MVAAIAAVSVRKIFFARDIETVFLMADVDKQVISSRFVKEIAKLNGKVDKFVTKSAALAIKNKI